MTAPHYKLFTNIHMLSTGTETGSEKPARLDPALAHLLASARSDALRQEFLKADPGSYATEHALRIYAATYNLNGGRAGVHGHHTKWPCHLWGYQMSIWRAQGP